MDLEENGYEESSPPWENTGVKKRGLELMNDDDFLRFLAERLVSLTDWTNDKLVAFLLLG